MSWKETFLQIFSLLNWKIQLHTFWFWVSLFNQTKTSLNAFIHLKTHFIQMHIKEIQLTKTVLVCLATTTSCLVEINPNFTDSISLFCCLTFFLSPPAVSSFPWSHCHSHCHSYCKSPPYPVVKLTSAGLKGSTSVPVWCSAFIH